MRKPRNRLVIFAVVMAFILSCGIPTSIPILPREVAIKVGTSVSMPLGEVKYNLYSGLSGTDKAGSLDSLMGSGWLKDFEDSGAKIYDYRPADTSDDGVQKLLVHYKMDMKDTMGSSGEVDMSEYREMLDDLAGMEQEITGVSNYTIPSASKKNPMDVIINLDSVTEAISTSFGNMGGYTAYLPVTNGTKSYAFPDEVKKTISENNNRDFSVTLTDLDSLTFQHGTLDFTFTITDLINATGLTTLTLSGFGLRDSSQAPIPGVTGSNTPVVLNSASNPQTTTITFGVATLPNKFELYCTLAITGTSTSHFDLTVEPKFTAYAITGVEGLVLSDAQIASLAYELDVEPYSIGDDLGPSFKALIETGNLDIDTSALFPSMDKPGPNGEGWNLTKNLSNLRVNQQDVPENGYKGLSLGGPNNPVHEGANDLHGETLNNQDVNINGTVTTVAPGKKLSFRNLPGGITHDGENKYTTTINVNMDVSLFSTVLALAEDFGLGDVDQTITQGLGSDFASLQPWLNYIQFRKGAVDDPRRGVGVVISITTLRIVGGLGLYIDAPEFGLHNVFRRLEARGDETAELIFTYIDEEYAYDEEYEGYRLLGTDLPQNGGDLVIDVKLGLENTAAQKVYEETGILTMKNVVPGNKIIMEGAVAKTVFDWTEMSVKPRPKSPDDKDSSMPDYPFTGTFPEKDGIDLSDMPAGFVFYTPADDSPAELAKAMSAQAYIGLERRVRNASTGEWETDPWDDPDSIDYYAEDPTGWRKNMKVNIPSLDFRIRYGNAVEDLSDNLFTYDPTMEKDIGRWALSQPVNLDPDGNHPEKLEVAVDDAENADNPFRLYGHPLPEPDKAIPLGNFRRVFNEMIIGQKKKLFFEYTVEMSNLPAKEGGQTETRDMLLYPDMLNKAIVVSVDLLILIPLRFEVVQAGSDIEGHVVKIIDPDMGGDDLFGRSGPEDNGFFDMVTSFGFDVAVKNMAGLQAGKFFMENKTRIEEQKYRLPNPVLDFANPKNRFFLSGEEMQKLKETWPFVPQLAIDFAVGDILAIDRYFAIDLRSITVKAGGEFTFETGL